MRHWDVIVVGCGMIGLAVARELRKQNAQVLIIERGEPGREASSAAAGMLADSEIDNSSPLKPLAVESARMYPDFVHELEDESGIHCDLRDQGTLKLSSRTEKILSPQEIAECEPALSASIIPLTYVEERSVDPRGLTLAAVKSAKHRGIDISSGSEAIEILFSSNRTGGIRTDRTQYHAPIVVNCLGAWSGQFGPVPLPVRPVKGQMLCVVGGPDVRHVIRGAEHNVYIVPRTNGRILIGSSAEEAGFDKRTDSNVIRRLREAAQRLIPGFVQSRMIEAWAGLRPGTTDNLPILGASRVPGYFVATGHFRDGILLAPITARLMAQAILGKNPGYDLSAFAVGRFCDVDTLRST